MSYFPAGPLYYQLSTEAFPTDLQTGARLQFIDTGEKFIFDGNGWVEDLRDLYVAQHS